MGDSSTLLPKTESLVDEQQSERYRQTQLHDPRERVMRKPRKAGGPCREDYTTYSGASVPTVTVLSQLESIVARLRGPR